jgi:hypothetical protein
MHPCTVTFWLHASPGAKVRISTLTQKKKTNPLSTQQTSANWNIHYFTETEFSSPYLQNAAQH